MHHIPCATQFNSTTKTIRMQCKSIETTVDIVNSSVEQQHLLAEDNNEDANHPTGEKKQRLSKQEKKEQQREKQRLMILETRERKRQQKKELQQQRIAAGEIPIRIVCEDPAIIEERKQRKLEERKALHRACNANFEVILDCAWENEHTPQALQSLIQQIMFCYGANKKSSNPCTMRLFGMGPQTKERLDKIHYSNWLEFHAYHDDITAHLDWYSLDPVRSDNEPLNLSSSTTTESVEAPTSANTMDGESSTVAIQIPSRKRQLVYLTSDAEETLETLDPNCAYIIGGIVDRNRLKGITYEKSRAHKIRSAKLPIKELFALAATHVLTVNHVFDIMLRYQQTKNWVETMNLVLPKRKEPKAIRDDAHSRTSEIGKRHNLDSDNDDDDDDINEGQSDAKRSRYEDLEEDK